MGCGGSKSEASSPQHKPYPAQQQQQQQHAVNNNNNPPKPAHYSSTETPQSRASSVKSRANNDVIPGEDDDDNASLDMLLVPDTDAYNVDEGKLSAGPDPEPVVDPEEEAAFDATLTPITREGFIQHNQQRTETGDKHDLWTTDSRRVYHGYALYQRLLPAIQATINQKGKYQGQCITLYNDELQAEKSYNKAMFFLLQLGLPRKDLHEAKRACIVGKFVDDPSSMEKNKEHIEALLESIETETDSAHMVDFAKCAERQQLKFDSDRGTVDDINGDPNDRKFVLPEGVRAEDVRAWAAGWQEFDLSIDEGGWVWTRPTEPDGPGPDAHETFVKSVRPWMDDWESFDLTIDAEAAWVVLSQDTIKNDEATAEQLKCWKAREANPDDYNNPTRMAMRRDQICEYFVREHKGWTPDILVPYMSWAATIEASGTKFQEICTTWEPSQRGEVHNILKSSSIHPTGSHSPTSEQRAISCHGSDLMSITSRDLEPAETTSEPNSAGSSRPPSSISIPISRVSSSQSRRSLTDPIIPHSAQSAIILHSAQSHRSNDISRPTSAQSAKSENIGSRPSSARSAIIPHSAQSHRSTDISRPTSAQSAKSENIGSRPTSAQSAKSENIGSRPSSAQSQRSLRSTSARPLSARKSETTQRTLSAQSQNSGKITSRPSSAQSQNSGKITSRSSSAQSQKSVRSTPTKLSRTINCPTF